MRGSEWPVICQFVSPATGKAACTPTIPKIDFDDQQWLKTAERYATQAKIFEEQWYKWYQRATVDCILYLD